MLGFLLRRLGIAFCVAVTVSVISFSLLHLSGDLATAIGGPEASSEQIEQIRVQYGLDKPLPTQYFNWLGDLLRLDLGNSFFFQESVYNLIVNRLPITLGLGAMALGIALLVAIPLGVLAAVKRDTWVDRLALSIAVLGQAMPSFWFALMLIVVFAVTLKWLPVSGNSTMLHFVMPAIALGYYATPAIMRLTRAGMLDVLSSDYIRTARAKGLPLRHIILRHALRPAMLPVVSYLGPAFVGIITGSVVIETIFGLPGIGQLFVNGALNRDYSMVLGLTILVGALTITFNAVVDILYAVIDPKIRY